MAADDVRAVADVLEDWYPGARRIHEDAADALLRTVVERLMREARAEALRDAAAWALENWNEEHHWLERRAEAAESDDE